MYDSGPYKTVEPGGDGDGVADLILDPFTESGMPSLTIRAEGGLVSGYTINSEAGIFTGADLIGTGFKVDTDTMLRDAWFGNDLPEGEERSLGEVIGDEWEIMGKPPVNPYDDLTFTYTLAGVTGPQTGTLIIIPEPGTVVMLLGVAGALLLLVIRRRRRRA